MNMDTRSCENGKRYVYSQNVHGVNISSVYIVLCVYILSIVIVILMDIHLDVSDIDGPQNWLHDFFLHD